MDSQLVGKIVSLLLLTTSLVSGIRITIDYRFDSRGFFDSPKARLSMEAAAARWSRIVDQTLSPVSMTDGAFVDGRFQIIHPETGEPYIFSAAAGPSSDFTLKNNPERRVDEYLDGFNLEKDEMIVFVGSRVMNSENVLGKGGAIQDGGNLYSVYTDPESFLNRGFNLGLGKMTMLGGFISFDADRRWSFDLNSGGGPNDAADFYSVALHEIGHTLGLNSRMIDEWKELVTGDYFQGQNAVAAYNEDHGSNLKRLRLHNPSFGDHHWRNNLYQSKIFPYGTPLLRATVGSQGFQELLMDPAYNPTAKIRHEVTNVDAAALRDLGWSIIDRDPPRPPILPVEISRSPSGGLGVQIPSKAGSVYVIQTSPDGVSWVDVYPPLIGDGGPLSWSDGEEGFVDPFEGMDLTRKFVRVVQRN